MSPAPHHNPLHPDSPRDPWRAFQASFVSERQLWLIRMRWVAIVFIAATVSLAAWNGWVRNTWQLFAITLVMAGYNSLFLWAWKVQSQEQRRIPDENSVFPPILCDLASLTLLLHWSGGIQNPFAVFFVFHNAIGATFLSPRRAYALGATTLLLWTSTITLEYAGLLQHHSLLLDSASIVPLSVTGQSTVAFTGYVLAFGLMLFGVIYFVQAAERGRRQAESRAFYRERQAMARERMARIGEISAGIAHTVRNPLQGVINCLDLIKDQAREKGESSLEVYELMDEGLQRVERVTRRLLVLSRERHLQIIPNDVQGLVEASLRFLRADAEKNQIVIAVREMNVPPVAFDSEAMNEALICIIDNAVQACTAGDTITISAERLEHLPPTVAISIKDTGIGIPHGVINKVFDPFFTTKSVGEGTGLGLAIAREIVEEHQGTLSATSDHERGSCFKITLPIQQ